MLTSLYRSLEQNIQCEDLYSVSKSPVLRKGLPPFLNRIAEFFWELPGTHHSLIIRNSPDMPSTGQFMVGLLRYFLLISSTEVILAVDGHTWWHTGVGK